MRGVDQHKHGLNQRQGSDSGLRMAGRERRHAEPRRPRRRPLPALQLAKS